MSAYKFDIHTLNKAIWNGDFRHAKFLIQYKARYSPELQAYRMGLAIQMLSDADHPYSDPDAATRLIEEFNPANMKRK